MGHIARLNNIGHNLLSAIAAAFESKTGYPVIQSDTNNGPLVNRAIYLFQLVARQQQLELLYKVIPAYSF